MSSARDSTQQFAEYLGSVSSAHLQQMLALSPSVLYSCGPAPDFATTFISHNVSDQLGFAPQLFLRDPFFWTNLIHPTDRARVLDELRRLQSTDTISYEYRVRHREGHYRWLHDELSAVRTAGGSVNMLVGCWYDVTEERCVRAQQEGQLRVLARLAGGSSLEEALAELVRSIEDQAPGMLCSILVYDQATCCLRHGAAPNLPAAYIKAVDGLRIGAAVGSCGTAAQRRERVIVEDIEHDPLWAEFRELALQHDLRACWSQPILRSADHLLGTFAMYYRHPRGPTTAELQLIERAADLAALAIDRKRAADALRDSEAKYQDLYDHAPDMFVSYDANSGEVLNCNSTLINSIGFARAEIIGRHVFEMYDDSCMDKVRRTFQQFLETGTVRDAELQLRCKDGRTMDVSLNASAVRDAAGTIRFSRAIWREITERKRAEAALIEQSRLTELVADVRAAFGHKRPPAETLGDCAEALVRRLDAALARIWTYSPIGNELELVASAGLYTHLDGGHSRIKVGELKIGRIAHLRKAHLTNDVLNDPVIDRAWAKGQGLSAFAGYPLLVEGRLVGVMAMFSRSAMSDAILRAMSAVADIMALGIERKHAEEVLQRSEKLAAIGTLAAGIAHEVNNPITAILVSAQLALHSEEACGWPEVVRECLSGVVKDAERCEQIVGNVLQFARSGTTDRLPTDVGQVLSRAVSLTRAYACERGTGLTLNLPDELPPVSINAGQIEQVVINLVHNAVDAGGRGNEVSVSTECSAEAVCIRVTDRGAGMTPEERRRLFDPFYTTRSAQGGTGLGLSIAHGIVCAHGGDIDVITGPGHGTTMVVQLPLQQPTGVSKTEGP